MKKGYYYSVTVLLFTSILLAVFLSQSDVNSSVEVHQKRIAAMDDFLDDLHEDIDRAAFIAGFRTFLAMEEHVATNGSYLVDTESTFVLAFLNGTINGVSYAVLENATFGDYIQRVQVEANDFGLTLNLSVDNVSLYHITPWAIAVDYDVNILLNDSFDETRWNYTKSFSTLIDISGLRDPLYSVETNNKLPNTVRTYDDFLEFINDTNNQNDTTVLDEFMEESYYSNNPSAPTFLMRFTGDLSSHEFGMESLVNLFKLDGQSLPVYTTRSMVDYQYFSGVLATNCTNETVSKLRLDENHAFFYELNEIEGSGCS